MGEMVTFNITGSYFSWIAFGIVIFFSVVYLIGSVISASVDRKEFLRWLTIALIITGIGMAVRFSYDLPRYQQEYETALNRAHALRMAHQGRFYLKEEAHDTGIHGEIRGEIRGGFLSSNGKIYGSISTGRMITVVYKDNDPVIDRYVGVYRVKSFYLDQAVIKTIPAGNTPYLSYPSARVQERKNPEPFNKQIMWFIPGPPHLYLPEGWEILQ